MTAVEFKPCLFPVSPYGNQRENEVRAECNLLFAEYLPRITQATTQCFTHVTVSVFACEWGNRGLVGAIVRPLNAEHDEEAKKASKMVYEILDQERAKECEQARRRVLEREQELQGAQNLASSLRKPKEEIVEDPRLVSVGMLKEFFPGIRVKTTTTTEDSIDTQFTQNWELDLGEESTLTKIVARGKVLLLNKGNEKIIGFLKEGVLRRIPGLNLKI